MLDSYTKHRETCYTINQSIDHQNSTCIYIKKHDQNHNYVEKFLQKIKLQENNLNLK